MQVTPVLTATTLTMHGISYPAVTDEYLNITVAFKPDTYLPYIVRSYEDHHIYGNSTSDFVLYNYTTVAGVQFPRRIKLMYNEDNMLIDTLIDTVEVNPTFTADFFQSIPLSQVNQTLLQIPPVPPMPSTEYGDAEVFENRQVHYTPQDECQLNCNQPKSSLVWGLPRYSGQFDGDKTCA